MCHENESNGQLSTQGRIKQAFVGLGLAGLAIYFGIDGIVSRQLSFPVGRSGFHYVDLDTEGRAAILAGIFFICTGLALHFASYWRYKFPVMLFISVGIIFFVLSLIQCLKDALIFL